METHTCHTCHIERSLNEFYWRDKQHTKVASWECCQCHYIRTVAWRAAHQVEIRIYNRVYHHDHAEEACARSKNWNNEHPEQVKERQREYRKTHKKEIHIQKEIWRKTNPDKVKASHDRRRARKANAPVNDLSSEQFKEICTAFHSRCAYCGKKSQSLTQDHVVPYKHNGSHTLWNVVPACRSCNCKKGTGVPLNPVQPLLLTIAAPTKKKEP